jgi:ARID/BRIGHT DNA binding domain
MDPQLVSPAVASATEKNLPSALPTPTSVHPAPANPTTQPLEPIPDAGIAASIPAQPPNPTPDAFLPISIPEGSSMSEDIENDDEIKNDDDDIAPSGRVDVLKMAVQENPLSKSDRYTVIKGRLPDSDPFMRASALLGVSFMSREMRASTPNLVGSYISEENRAQNFMRDIEAFNRELNRDFKIPIIGGGQLCLYALAQEVMRLGGLKNVVQNRAFRIVGQQLELPKSCTSAAFVLKNAYERLLYQYEQKIAFDITPVNPGRTIDMKSLVSETKKRDQGKKRSAKATSLCRFSTPATGIALNDPSGRIVKRSASQDVARYLQEAIQSQRIPSQFGGSKTARPLAVDLFNSRPITSSHTIPMETFIPQLQGSKMNSAFPCPPPGSIPSLSQWQTPTSEAVRPCDDNNSLANFGEGEEDPFQINAAAAEEIYSPPAASPGIFFFGDFLSTGRISLNLKM